MDGKRVAIYARVSTSNGQTPENQLVQLREVAAKAGWQVVDEFVDQGISGAKGRDKRPALLPARDRQVTGQAIIHLGGDGAPPRNTARRCSP